MYQNAPRVNVVKGVVIMLYSVSFWRKSVTENEILLHVKPSVGQRLLFQEKRKLA